MGLVGVTINSFGLVGVTINSFGLVGVATNSFGLVGVAINSFGLVGVTCPVTCPVANYFFFTAFKSFFTFPRSSPVATYD